MSGLAEILEENRRLREALASRDGVLRDRESQLRERESALRERDREVARLTAERDAVRLRAEQLARELELLALKRSGPVSMRYVPDGDQVALPMFPDVEAPPRSPVVEEALGEDEDAIPRRDRRKTGTPRRRDRASLAHLPSRTVRCPTSSDATCAGCGGALNVIGQAESFRVAWVPGHFVVEDVVRDKCACPSCPDQGVLTVPGPYALDKALCADSLLARVLVDKFADHLPLHRQARRMARESFDVGTNTLSSWVVQAAAVLHVVAEAVRTELLAGDFLQADDSGFPVQDGGDGKLRKGRMWVFSDQQQVVYDFTDTKEGRFPLALLDGFQGDCLLVDGGTEFNAVVGAQDLTRAGCWSHLRTYFCDALPHHPHEADLALGTLRDLFLLERQLVGLTAEQRLDARRRNAQPLVDGFFGWIKALSVHVRPSTKLMEAITYATNQEPTLRAFLERGDIPIHNNLSELLLRQHVVGRKNWLFARSEGGARAAATMFTLIGSCMLQGIDPHAYLTDILPRVLDHPAKRVGELTPRAWRERHMGAVG